MTQSLFNGQWTHGGIAMVLGLAATSVDRTFMGVTIDSRLVKTGFVFAAITGEKFDGHDFIPRAINEGATGILFKKGKLVSGWESAHPQISFFPVDDVEAALRKLAADRRTKVNCPVLCVAGSVGKTTTKELIAALLRTHVSEQGLSETNVLATKGSENGFLGIPITLMNVTPTTKFAVIEVGIDDIGAMKQHVDLLNPTHSLLTAIGPEHLEKLRDVDTVLAEEWLAISETLKNGGTVYLQESDPLIEREGRTVPAGESKIRVSFTDPGATFYAEKKPEFPQIFHLTQKGVATHGPFTSPLLGDHNLRNVALAVAVALDFGVKAETVERGLRAFQPAFGRTDVKKLGNSEILCDYYNANPSSVKAALEAFTDFKAARKFIALGDMLELGANEEDYHRALSGEILPKEFSGVFLYGERMKWLRDEIGKSSGRKPAVFWASTHEELAEELKKAMQDGDALLIKGSRSMKMEKVFEAFAKASGASA